MNIAFFSEGGYSGKIPRNNPNMRTDQAWICALNATHHCVFQLNNIPTKYDIGVVIIPKEKNREHLANNNYPLIQQIKSICNKVLVMQESTHWDWQDEPFTSMVWYYNQLTEADGILCHNDIDIPYFKGITDKPAFILPTLMIEDTLQLSTNKEDRVFVAGNWHTTYRGFDSWVIGNEFDLPLYGFKSGKFKQGEEQNGVNYLPWMNWSQFMFELSKCKFGVQTYQASAGQFPLNCAYLGIPCIGYNDINTQKDLFPSLSVERGDIQSARKLVNKLQTDPEFYNRASKMSKQLYTQLYTEDKFLKKWQQIESHL
jgi:hypothetical protein